ncbi:MAG TPA: c-type cytochrome [Candidatus Kryptonia bacterium]|nr:c-type cytochrome [Candidatus Kryptonia bacterium]
MKVWRRAWVTVGLVAALSGAAAPLRAETDPAKAAYLKYCSACHGETGKGDGVVSGFMQPRPTDLTQLAKKNGGQFPMTQVVRDIDGTQTVRAHGTREMPVWGEIFREATAGQIAGESQARVKSLLIAEHVRTLQMK